MTLTIERTFVSPYIYNNCEARLQIETVASVLDMPIEHASLDWTQTAVPPNVHTTVIEK